MFCDEDKGNGIFCCGVLVPIPRIAIVDGSSEAFGEHAIGCSRNSGLYPTILSMQFEV